MTEHIRIATEDDQVIVTVDDTELFDYVEDVLTEKHDLVYEYLTTPMIGSRRFYVMRFPKSVSLGLVSDAIAELPSDEIQRIWLLNNDN